MTFATLISIIGFIAGLISPVVAVLEAERRRRNAEEKRKNDKANSEFKDRRDLDDCIADVDDLKKTAVRVSDLAGVEKSINAAILSLKADATRSNRRLNTHLKLIYAKLKAIDLSKELAVVNVQLANSLSDVVELKRKVGRLERFAASQGGMKRDGEGSDINVGGL